MTSFTTDSSQKKPEIPLPLSLLFLKSVVVALGIVLVVGFTFVISMILLGGKYIAERAVSQPYELAQEIKIIHPDKNNIISTHISPAGIEIFSKNKQNDYILSIYAPKSGDLLSTVTIASPAVKVQ